MTEVLLARQTGWWVASLGTMPVSFLLGCPIAGLVKGDLATGASAGLAGFLLAALIEAPLLAFAWSQVLGDPALVIDPDGITIRHPGVLRRPIRIARTDVHSIYVLGPDEPRLENHAHEAGLRKRPHEADRREIGAETLARSDSVLLPDMSSPSATPNLLIVFKAPLQLGHDVRRGMGVVNAVLSPSAFPTRLAYARGLLAKADDAGVARSAFEGWPTATEIPADVDAWLQGFNPGTARSGSPPH